MTGTNQGGKKAAKTRKENKPNAFQKLVQKRAPNVLKKIGKEAKHLVRVIEDKMNKMNK